MKILRLAPVAVACFCIATVLAESIGLAVLWSRGALRNDKLVRILAVVYDVDMTSMQAELKKAAESADQEQLAYEELLKARLEASLDLDLRENAVTRGLGDLRNLEKELKTEGDRYAQLKTSFDAALTDLEGEQTDTSIREVQRTLEALQPKQAKDQILKMLEDDAMKAVVAMIKAMAVDKRKKILGEFKTPEEAEKLKEILREIRIGEPEVSMIQDARRQSQQF